MFPNPLPSNVAIFWTTFRTKLYWSRSVAIFKMYPQTMKPLHLYLLLLCSCFFFCCGDFTSIISQVKTLFSPMCMRVGLCKCIVHSYRFCGRQQRVLGPLELELQAAWATWYGCWGQNWRDCCALCWSCCAPNFAEFVYIQGIEMLLLSTWRMGKQLRSPADLTPSQRTWGKLQISLDA